MTLSIDQLTKAEEIGAISFEMSGEFALVLGENQRLRLALSRALDEIRNHNGGDALADSIREIALPLSAIKYE